MLYYYIRVPIFKNLIDANLSIDREHIKYKVN